MRKKLPLISGILNVLEKLKGNTGIIENTSVATHTIAAGKYVIWKNDLYKASSAISIGDTLSLSNLTAVSDGIANELNSKFISSPVQVSIRTNITNGYTLQDDAYVYIEWRSTTEGHGADLLIDGASIARNNFTYFYTMLIPLKKGSVITFTGAIDIAFASIFTT